MSVQPVRISQTAWRGATFKKRYAVLQSDGVSAKDLSNYTGRFVVLNVITGNILLDETTETGGVTLTSDGAVVITIADEITETLPWNAGVYKLFLTDANGDTDLVLHGSFKVKKQ
jgi:hypothetical protein